MSSDKKLMNEVLPAPVIAPRGSPRDRVLRHMRDALAAGASVALLTGCPFAVVDPLPPPAQCRTTGADKLIQVTVNRATDADGGQGDVSVSLSWASNAGYVLAAPKVMNGTVVMSTETSQSANAWVTPAAGATEFDVIFPATCDDGRSAPRTLGVRVIIDVAALTAIVAEVPPP